MWKRVVIWMVRKLMRESNRAEIKACWRDVRRTRNENEKMNFQVLFLDEREK